MVDKLNRRGSRGVRPGVRGEGPMGRVPGDQEQWRFPKVVLSEGEKKDLIATVVRIATEFMFRNHIYSFGGKMYKQSKGGPIGLRGTCAIARLVMCMWNSKWIQKMEKSKVRMELAMRYMDDGRAFLFPIKAGWRWGNGDLVYCKKWECEDKELSPVEITRRVLHGTMMEVEEFLRFTMETEDDFALGWLPTLDTALKVGENNHVHYTFYEKPVSSNITVQFGSAMDDNSKMKVLANDLTRRLLNMSDSMGEGERVKVVDQYSQNW